MKQVNIAVKSDRDNLYLFKKDLKQMGFQPDGTKFVKKTRSKAQVEQAKDYCKKNHLIFLYNNSYGERSTNYRSAFFAHNPPERNGKYRCVYCGKLKKKSDITIDHLYPVSVVSKDLGLQSKLHRQGIKSLNSPNNLVASCRSCNQKKGTSMGIWILKGKLGRHKGYWAVRKILFLSVSLGVLGMLYLVIQKTLF